MRLVARGVGKRFGPLAVLDDISLEVGPGEIVAVVGPSGCGKSTLLRILGGLERADAGVVETVGAPPSASLNPITYVFQDFALLPWRSVLDNVCFALEHRVGDRARRREMATQALAALGLSEFHDAFPKQLSGGMKQRVGLARALAVKPAVLLMDEPLSALDAQTRELFMADLVRLLAREPFAGVYVTHNLDEAALLARRIVVLSRRPGRVRRVFEVDTPVGARSADDPAIVVLRQAIWEELRADAAAADREILDV
ncbi:MAG: ABC transporter ATP-binding protein [Rhodoblastus sp.]|nr:MAG: ABC transporter ATP-binding protein [Rhodoblastus sp.]